MTGEPALTSLWRECCSLVHPLISVDTPLSSFRTDDPSYYSKVIEAVTLFNRASSPHIFGPPSIHVCPASEPSKRISSSEKYRIHPIYTGDSLPLD
jgi:hypothetical protein